MVSPPNSLVSFVKKKCKLRKLVTRNLSRVSGRSVTSCTPSRKNVVPSRIRSATQPDSFSKFVVMVSGVEGTHGHTAIRAITPALATSTWQSRSSLWNRLQEFGTDTTPTTAVSFVHGLEVSVQSKLAYAKSLKATFMQMGMECRPMEMYIKALQAQGALVPISQARAIRRVEMQRLIPNLSKEDAAMITLVWKAASRWTETARLKKINFVSSTPMEVIVSWGQGTKSTRLNPYTTSMYTVITGPGTERVHRRVTQMSDTEPFSSLSVERMNVMLRRLLGPGFTTHGFKHGAIEELMEAVGRNELSLEDVMRLAKHQQVETTLRYAGNPEVTARALKTQRATVMLKC